MSAGATDSLYYVAVVLQTNVPATPLTHKQLN